MSFILDALKKSEAERARQAGPALLEMRIVRPRRRVAPWIIVLVLLLAVNLSVLSWFLLRREPAATPAAAASAAATSPLLAAPAAAAPGAAAATAPGPTAPAPPAAATDTDAATLRTGSALPPAGAFVADPGARVAGEAEPADTASDNPADFEPAASPPAGSVRSARTARPNYSELGSDVPELRLDLHVYASRAQERYALINMHKVREGEALPEGPRVVEITRDGVLLEWQGREFVLGRE